MEKCFCKVEFRQSCSSSMAADSNSIVYVEMPKGMWRDELEKKLSKKIDGFQYIIRVQPIDIIHID